MTEQSKWPALIAFALAAAILFWFWDSSVFD